MEDLDLRLLFDYYHNKLSSVRTSFHRYVYDQINWDSRLIGLIGARGVGKTTLMIQRIQKSFKDKKTALYVSLDNIWFNAHTLYDLAQYASSHGITHLFLDEVHRYATWRQEIKMINDTLNDLNVVYTGSSILEIGKAVADLSRRQTLYHMYGMSFREFLKIEGLIDLQPIDLNYLVQNHQDLALDITQKVKVLPAFELYLKHGYYPFYKEAKTDYLIRLNEVVQTVLDIDLAAGVDISYETIKKAKRLLVYIANSTPFTPDLTTLFKSIGVGRDTGLMLINMLFESQILTLLSTKKPNYKNLVIPEKIFLNNPNLMFALSGKPDIGTMRESFFTNQLCVRHQVNMPAKGDFLIDNKFLFEVGGHKKKFDQIADVPDSYLAVDDTEVGFGNRIPLWMFGLLY